MRNYSSLFLFAYRKKVLLLPLLFLMAWNANAQSWTNINGFGSAGGEQGRGVCTDASGNVYYVGTFFNTIDFAPGGGTSLASAGNSDVVISKYNAAGAFQWAVKGGGANADAGNSIATNGTDVFITGTFITATTMGSTGLTSVGGTDVFVAKLSAATGAFTWAVNVGSGGGDAVYGICVDGSGNPYITGNYFGTITLGPNALTTTGGGSFFDMFIARFNGSTGAVVWGNGGGSTGTGDNGPATAGICYVPGVDEIVVAGTYGANAATYGSFTLPAGTTNNLCLLELSASAGTFLAATGVNSGGNEEGLGVCYDASTQDVFLTGDFDGTSATFGSTTLNNSGVDDQLFVARYSISTDAFVWAVKSTSGGVLQNKAYAICSNGQGQVTITGQFENAITLGSTTLTAVSPDGYSDVLVAGLAVTNGAWAWALRGGSNDASVDETGRGISAGGPQNKIAVTGVFAGTATFGSLGSIVSAGAGDLFIAQISGPLSASVAGTNATCVNGCNGSATVTASGGVTPYSYSWSPSGGTGATASGLCVGTYTVTITDNVSTSIQRMVSIGLPATQLATATTSNTTVSVNTSNTNLYDASCNLIATVQPTGGGTAIAGTVAARVWIEAGVPVYPAVNGTPYVARHYEITPATNASTATGIVTLYFTQAEFTAFNAAPGSTLNLPTGSADATGKANLRVSKFSGASNNPATGLPGTYTGTRAVLDPVDASIVWNATLSRWEVSFNVTGFSGFFVQTAQTVLPLTWLELKGFLDAESHTVINWKADEQQVASYTIEKSVNGAPFTAIGTVASAGNGEHAYHYREAKALAGTATYRIKQTDIDGRFTYSRILLITQDRDAWITLYPNPVKQLATLNITDQSLMNTGAVLVDGTGRLVQRIQIQQSVTTINMARCSPGVYTLKMQNGRNIKILKE